jgi:ankyrin repeat protein
MLSCINSNNKSVKLLLEYKADVNLKGNIGYTALMLSCMQINTYSNKKTVKLLLNVDDIDVNIISNDTKFNALMLLCQDNSNQHGIAKLLKSKTDLNHRNYQNKKIEDVCLGEYKYLFSNTLEDFLQKHETIKSECFLCNEEEIDCIKCEFDHFTCFNCLPKVKYNCEACRKPI